MATGSVADEPRMGPIDQDAVPDQTVSVLFLSGKNGTFASRKTGGFELCCLCTKKPHRTGSCEVTVASPSDAVRPRRAWIPAFDLLDLSKARVLISSLPKPPGRVRNP